jgi:cold-inducible RNA-binding protein
VGKKLYVGNLPFSATEEDITAKFSACGTVSSAKLITDRDTGRSKGFGFVEMATDSEAQAAIDKLNGQDYGGRPMTVNEARPQEKKGPRGGGYGGGGGRGGYGGGGGGGRGGYGGGGGGGYGGGYDGGNRR